MTFYQRAGKRLFDIVCSAVGLLICSPLLLGVAVGVKFSSPGPVFFRQQRVGRSGKLFQILKFRSMLDAANRLSPGITASGDPRVTGLGRILRKLKLDELPQLWNVLVGDMSLVGPRPELPKYVATYSPGQRRVLLCRPGITDLASVTYRHEEEVLAASPSPERLYRESVLPHKLQLGLEYIDNISFLCDLRLIVLTFLHVGRTGVPRHFDKPPVPTAASMEDAHGKPGPSHTPGVVTRVE